MAVCRPLPGSWGGENIQTLSMGWCNLTGTLPAAWGEPGRFGNITVTLAGNALTGVSCCLLKSISAEPMLT